MNIQFLPEQDKEQSSRHLAQLSIWRVGLSILDSYQCSLEVSHALLIVINSEF